MFDNKKAFCNGCAAFQSTICLQILHPFDLIKTRFQSYLNFHVKGHDGQSQLNNVIPKYNGLKDAFIKIKQTEGIRGLYKGVWFSMGAGSFSSFVFFGIYNGLKNQNPQSNKLQQIIVFKSSSIAAIVSTIITQPIWMIKTRMLLNTQTDLGYRILQNSVADIYRQYGIKGFFRGLSLSLMLSINGVLQLQVYENLNHFSKKITNQNNQLLYLFSTLNGFISKAATMIFLYPLTTIRTRIQQPQIINEKHQPKYKNVLDIIQKIYLLEGYKGLYKGLCPAILRNSTSSAIWWTVFEFSKNVYRCENL